MEWWWMRMFQNFNWNPLWFCSLRRFLPKRWHWTLAQPVCMTIGEVSEMTAVGFEPTQLALVELESTPLDHSGKLSLTTRSFLATHNVKQKHCQPSRLPFAWMFCSYGVALIHPHVWLSVPSIRRNHEWAMRPWYFPWLLWIIASNEGCWKWSVAKKNWNRAKATAISLSPPGGGEEKNSSISLSPPSSSSSSSSSSVPPFPFSLF